ncbi:PH domain-containing protein [Alienimonas californiensis]|uniref:Bacterial membrane flanked domain protein n=1 Tax=Alienimonas californiensis TaxID=2527989 RepID=A0A517P5K7_9PLAN|nr:PH domain-containing protein [Alienimonas californiensis]QDT14652.1 Bacterial membrane flanked domain protein [Alienimonas californiensis]
MADVPTSQPDRGDAEAGGDAAQVQHLTYQCPHCGAKSSVAEVLMGERIDCRRCHKPFELGVPVAQPIRDEPGAKADYVVDPGGGDTEEVVFVTHPAAFRNRPGKAFLAVLAIALGVVGAIGGLIGGLGWGVIEPISGAIGGTVLAGIGGVLILLGAIPLLVWWLRSRFETLTITGRRTTFRFGLIARDTTEIQHDDVRNLQVDQSGLDRLFGVGDLFLSSSGQDDLEIRAYGIPHPEHAANVVRDLQ